MDISAISKNIFGLFSGELQRLNELLRNTHCDSVSDHIRLIDQLFDWNSGFTKNLVITYLVTIISLPKQATKV